MTRLFGTNGIRGVVNQDMNSTLALGIGQAWGTYLKKTVPRPRCAIGTDARLSNHMLKSAITAGFLSTGCDVVDVGLVPTPTLQYTVKEKRFDAGIIITASHNPPQFNGIKGTAHDGTELTKDVEEVIETIYFSKLFALSDWKDVGNYATWDGAIELYMEGVLSRVDVASIKKQRFHVVLDCGNGAGSLVTPILLKKLGCRVTKLNCKPDGTFPGRHSEPLPENLTLLMKKVSETQASFGVGLDGDADRAIFIDENGSYIWGDKSLSLVGKYITREKKGGVTVTPVTTSTCFEDVIHQNKGSVIYTKVGSPIVASVMKEYHAMFGGEENGGLIFPAFQYCRDSAMALATILEILATEKRPLSELVAEIPSYEMLKTKIACPNEQKEPIMNLLATEMNDNNKITKVDRTDGLKLYMKDGWVLLRPSGTEPIFRVYVEAKEKQQAERVAIFYKNLVESLMQRA
ncbi:MAG: phosphoglucosamine mutase [Euryarchaeota archaeon]|jgi:phosphomannomutase/phosphoglucomutase|nr:phosphoglucosamine mutase [Euryarchaeota archaeon]